MICDTRSSQDAFTHQIWNSYLKEYRKYAPVSMQFLETRSEVKFKVTVTQLWYTTLRHPKMHPHTKIEIPTSNNMRYALDTIILKTRSEIKVTVTPKWYVTLRHPKMHPHTKFGIPTSKNIGDTHWTRSGTDGRTDSVLLYASQSSFGAIKKCILVQIYIYEQLLDCFHKGRHLEFISIISLTVMSIFSNVL